MVTDGHHARVRIDTKSDGEAVKVCSGAAEDARIGGWNKVLPAPSIPNPINPFFANASPSLPRIMAKTPAKKTASVAKKAPTKKSAPKKGQKTAKKSTTKPKDRWAVIRAQLESRRAELLADAQQVLEGSLGSEKEVMAEIGDRATEEIDDNFQARLKGREHKLIAKIDDTLARMARGEYGLCEACGEEIAYARLLARPVTTMCIDCKTAQEAEERNFRR
jgi:RNA polymerase-binding transcription factor